MDCDDTTRRITPACAGNRLIYKFCILGIKDHPRVCGEQSCKPLACYVIKGSPPRVRGTVLKDTSTLHMMRITPACAGNSYSGSFNRCWLQDHPRVCGEQCTSVGIRRIPIGSPPRVRGTVVVPMANGSTKGITPACAGNRISLRLRLATMRDHPRVCGEQDYKQDYSRAALGSPPRVRGTDFYHSHDFEHDRITPACAGNSRRRADRASCRKDHPRVCGEQIWPQIAKPAL